MRSSKKPNVLSVALLALSLSVFGGCTDDEETMDPAVSPSPVEEPASPPPMEDAAVGFTADVVYFAFDSAVLRDDAQSSLNALGEHLLRHTGTTLNIEGHCDERGTHEYNLALGAQRAESVKRYLVQLGVADSRMTTISFGEERPAVEGHDEGAWSRNRRAEFALSQ